MRNRLNTPATPENMRVLSSDWGDLSDHLIAKFYPVERRGTGEDTYWVREPNSNEVRTPLSNGTMEQAQQWNSPFESQSVDAALSTFSRLLQSGGALAVLNALQQTTLLNSLTPILKDELNKGIELAKANVYEMAGRSGVTKLNSTQVWSGAPPLKLSFTAHFRAWSDPQKEVQRPVEQLMAWALPQYLAPEGVLTNVLKDGVALRTVYPSLIPTIVGMEYGRMLFSPFVIESISRPLTAPRDEHGHAIWTELTMTIASLTAIDAQDWKSISLT